MRFTALQDFISPELKSHYCKGLSYTVREGDDVLARLVPTWLEEGKVRLGESDEPGVVAAPSKIAGTGTVK